MYIYICALTVFPRGQADAGPGGLQPQLPAAAGPVSAAPVPAPGTHIRVDTRQSQKSIPRIYEGIDVKSQFPLPLT